MQIKLHTGKSQVILMILILSPYLFLKNVTFRHGFVDEFFANFVHEFKVRNSYEFARIRVNFLHEKLVMLRMACTVYQDTSRIFIAIYHIPPFRLYTDVTLHNQLNLSIQQTNFNQKYG